MQSDSNEAKASNTRRVTFSEHERAVLVAHAERVELGTTNEQLAYNKLFNELQLDEFAQARTRPANGFSKVLVPYDVSPETILIILRLVQAPMIGAIARVIGVGSPFFQRVTATEQEL